jgi:DNA-binding GntR family transcriptional regulator
LVDESINYSNRRRLIQNCLKGVFMNKNEVYETLRFKIVTNTIGPSEILNEKDLMEQFEIGRSPLRDVLFKLQEEELLITLPRLGYMVSPLDISEVRELVELRRKLEGFAGALAAERIVPSQIDELKTLIQEKEHASPPAHEAQNISDDFDSQFHHIIYDATGNRKLVKILKALHILMLRIWFHMGFQAIGFSRQAENFHEVLEALTNKDPSKAQQAMEEHVELYANKVREKFLESTTTPV